MFNNNHIAVHEVRYANSQENSLIVLFSDQREEQPQIQEMEVCLLYTSPSPRDGLLSRMPSSA